MDVDDTGLPEEKPKQQRRRRARTSTAAEKLKGRLAERAGKIETTIRELIRLKRPDLDVDGLTFLEVVERDANAWGRFLAQAGEWIVPFGRIVDLVFGAPVLLLVGLAPSVRAARRDLRDRGLRRKQRAEEEEAKAAEQEALEQEWSNAE